MSISGHLTRSVFERYDIMKKRRLADSVQRLDAYTLEKGIQMDYKAGKSKAGIS
jgi:hypothetical protein